MTRVAFSKSSNSFEPFEWMTGPWKTRGEAVGAMAMMSDGDERREASLLSPYRRVPSRGVGGYEAVVPAEQTIFYRQNLAVGD
jgi:hypothetical protein